MTTTNNKLVPHKRFPDFENSGDWEEKKLDNIGNFFRGHSYSKEDVSTEENGNTIVLRSNNIDEYRINYNDLQYVTKKCRKEIVVKNNDIIICMSNGSANLVGKNAYIRYDKIPHDKKIGDKDITVGAFCGIYRTENQIVKYFFQSDFYKKQLQTLFAGSNINNLKGTDILSMYISTPTSNQEQQKIADFLSTFDELIELEQKKLEKLQEYKKGLLQNLFPKENQKVPDLRFPEFKNSGDWEEKKIKDILNYEQPTNYIVESDNYFTYGTPVLTANKSFILGYTNETTGIYNNLPVIIFDDFTTDKKYVSFPFKVKSSAIKILSVKHKKYNTKFIYELISLINFIPQEHKRNYISIYQNIDILIPSFNEQQKIADFLSSVDELIIEQINEVKKLQEYKKGLLQQLFPNK